MATIGTLSVKAVAVFDDLFRGLSKAQSGIGALEKTFLGFGGAVSLAAGGLAAWAHVADDAALRAGRMAERLGLTTESVQALYEQAGRTGVSTNRLETWLHHSAEMLGMAKNQIDTAGGSFVKLNNGAKAFAELGISVAELRRNSDDQNFDRMLRALAAIKDPAQRAAVAYKLMGKSAVESFSLIRDGMAGLDALKAKMEATGVAISRPDFLKLQAGKEAFADIQLVFKGLGTQLALEMAPLMVGTARAVTDLLRNLGGVHAAARNIADGLITAVGTLAEVGTVALRVFNNVGFAVAGIVSTALRGAEAIEKALGQNGKDWVLRFNGIQELPSIKQVPGKAEQIGEMAKAFEDAAQFFKTELDKPLPVLGEAMKKVQEAAAAARKELDAASKGKGDGLGGAMSDWARLVSLQERSAKLIQDMEYPLATLARTYADLAEMAAKSFAPGAGLGAVAGLFDKTISGGVRDKALAQEFEKLASHAGLTKVQFAGALDVGSSEGARQAAVNQLNYQAHDAGVQNPQERVERILMELRDIEERTKEYARQTAEAIAKFIKPGAIP